eukprot:1626-Heterococcus_DN1.PRE.1
MERHQLRPIQEGRKRQLMRPIWLLPSASSTVQRTSQGRYKDPVRPSVSFAEYQAAQAAKRAAEGN